MKTAYIVYILKCKDGTLYTGLTVDLVGRLWKHNNLKSGAKYTKMRRPVELAYQENCKTRKEACAREAEIKRMERNEKIDLIKLKNLS